MVPTSDMATYLGTSQSPGYGWNRTRGRCQLTIETGIVQYWFFFHITMAGRRLASA